MKKHVALFSSLLMMSTTLVGAGSVFADTNTPEPAEAETPVSATLTINETPDKPIPPTEPGQGGTDEDTNITGLFGIAYAPGALAGNGELKTTGQTEIDLSNNSGSNEQNKHNIAVQDKTRAKDRSWILKAQLVWEGDTHGYMNGSRITGTEGNLNLNEEGTLSPVTEGEVTTTAKTLDINTGSQTDIMQAQNGKTVNGVYNYQFKDPKLVIPNSEDVTSGTYTGNIVWTLSNAMN
ncbi:WxL domain-containing protein [Enterococcus faecium]|nr:WxL domain-containing protein [Enterococcus faecium]